MALVTASLFIAASTGEAADVLADRAAARTSVRHQHKVLTSRKRIVFSFLLALLVALFFAPRLFSLPSGR